MRAKILTADDHPAICESARFYLGEQYEVTEAHSVEELRACLAEDRFDLTLLDLDFKSDTTGIDLIREIHEHGSKVAVYTGTCDLPGFRQCMALQVEGFMDKVEPPKNIPRMVETVLAGKKFLPQQMLIDALGRPEDTLPRLTYRETQILNYLINKPLANNGSIAATIHLSEGRVRNVLSDLFRKFEVENRHELITEAKRRGHSTWLPLPQKPKTCLKAAC